MAACDPYALGYAGAELRRSYDFGVSAVTEYETLQFVVYDDL